MLHIRQDAGRSKQLSGLSQTLYDKLSASKPLSAFLHSAPRYPTMCKSLSEVPHYVSTTGVCAAQPSVSPSVTARTARRSGESTAACAAKVSALTTDLRSMDGPDVYSVTV